MFSFQGLVELPSTLSEFEELPIPKMLHVAFCVYCVYALTHITIKLGGNILTKFLNDRLNLGFPQPEGSDMDWFFGTIGPTIKVSCRVAVSRLPIEQKIFFILWYPFMPLRAYVDDYVTRGTTAKGTRGISRKVVTSKSLENRFPVGV